MEENKDDYLKKKLHIKDRFIRRLETEKRQLEIDNNSLQIRLQNVEYQLSNLLRTQRNTVDWEVIADDPIPKPDYESTRINTPSHSMASTGMMTTRYIPFPDFKTSGLDEIKHDLQPSGAVNGNQDNENTKLLNENLECTLEISYLKARLKSSETARTIAERKIENLEEKLKQSETKIGEKLDIKDFNSNYTTTTDISPITSGCCQPQQYTQDMGFSHWLEKIFKAVVTLDDKISHMEIKHA